MGDAALRGASVVRPHTPAPKKILTIGEFLKTHGTTLDKHITERFKMGIREGLRRSNLSLKDIESFLESKEFKAILEETGKGFQKHFGSNEKIPNPKEALGHLNSRLRGYAIDLTQKIAPALEKAKLVGKTLDVKSILTGEKDVPIGTSSNVVKFEKPHQPPKNLGSPLGRGVVDVPAELREAAEKNRVAHLANRIPVKREANVLARAAKFLKVAEGAGKGLPVIGQVLKVGSIAAALIAANGDVAKAAINTAKETLYDYVPELENPLVPGDKEAEMLKKHKEQLGAKHTK